MRVCACACMCVYAYARARARERTRVYVLHKRRVLLPPLFLLHHPLSSSPLFSLAGPPPHSIQRRCRHHPRYGPRRQPWPSQVRASAERSAACAAGDLPERSLDGGKVGEEGGVQRGRGFSAPRRDSSHEGGRKAALPPLENPSSLFCANSSTLGRGSPLEELADASSPQGRFISAELSRMSKIFHGT